MKVSCCMYLHCVMFSSELALPLLPLENSAKFFAKFAKHHIAFTCGLIYIKTIKMLHFIIVILFIA